MKRLAIAICFGVSLAFLTACSGLFTPKLCTNRFTVVDSIKVTQGSDTAMHIDTLATLKVCTE